MTFQDTFTIREMCTAYDVTPRTLRFYEAKELLSPVRQGTRRLFTKQDRARLLLIQRGKRFGFSLEDIRQLLELYEHHGTNQAQMLRSYQLGKDRIAIMRAQHAELEVAIAELQTELSACEAVMANLSQAAE